MSTLLRNYLQKTGSIASNGLTTGTRATSRPGDQKDQETADIFHKLYLQRTEGVERRKADTAAVSTDLLEQVKRGDNAAKTTFLKTVEPTINAAIANIVGGDNRYKTRARLMALDAVAGFDPTQGTSINTYIYNRLQGLRRLSADRGNFVHVPEKSALERRQLEEIKRDYMVEYGVEPSLAELADRSGMAVRKVGRLMSIFGTTSTSATRGEHGDSLEAKPRTATELYNDDFYNELPEIDKKIYEWSTGYMGSPQLDRATIAKKLKISEAAVSQHVRKIDQRAARMANMLNRQFYGSMAENV